MRVMESKTTTVSEYERWEGVKSLPRVRELETLGMKRKAIARIFNVTTTTIRNAEIKESSQEPEEDQS